MSEEKREEKPQIEYQRFEGEAEFQKALDRFLELPGRELRLFDPDLKGLRLNSPARIAQLDNFPARQPHAQDLHGGARHRPPDAPVSAHAGPAQALHARDPDQPNARGDPQPAGRVLVLDAQHYLRRPMADAFRGAIGLNDETEALAMRSRFQEILVRVLSRRREHHGRAISGRLIQLLHSRIAVELSNFSYCLILNPTEQGKS